MNNLVKKFLELLKEKPCNHDKCREIIKEIGITNTITDNLGFKTTPLHLVIESNNYELAMELIYEPEVDLNISTEDTAPIIWDLQYLWCENDNVISISERRLKLLRKIIELGADSNPVVEGEDLISYIRFKLSENEETSNVYNHLKQMERIITESYQKGLNIK